MSETTDIHLRIWRFLSQKHACGSNFMKHMWFLKMLTLKRIWKN